MDDVPDELGSVTVEKQASLVENDQPTVRYRMELEEAKAPLVLPVEVVALDVVRHRVDPVYGWPLRRGDEQGSGGIEPGDDVPGDRHGFRITDIDRGSIENYDTESVDGAYRDLAPADIRYPAGQVDGLTRGHGNILTSGHDRSTSR